MKKKRQLMNKLNKKKLKIMKHNKEEEDSE